MISTLGLVQASTLTVALGAVAACMLVLMIRASFLLIPSLPHLVGLGVFHQVVAMIQLAHLTSQGLSHLALLGVQGGLQAGAPTPTSSSSSKAQTSESRAEAGRSLALPSRNNFKMLSPRARYLAWCDCNCCIKYSPSALWL